MNIIKIYVATSINSINQSADSTAWTGATSINSINQSADSTAWTGFLILFNYYSWYCVNANQLPTPTFYYIYECQDSLIQCSTSRFFCVNYNSLNLLLFVKYNINGSTYIGTVHHCFIADDWFILHHCFVDWKPLLDCTLFYFTHLFYYTPLFYCTGLFETIRGGGKVGRKFTVEVYTV